AGYRAALEGAGIEYDPGLVLVGGFTEESAAAPAREMLTMAKRPTAIFAANDLSAIQTMRTAAELGIAVPDEISIVGVANIPASALTDPPLTTVAQSMQALGREAVRTLLALNERGDQRPAEPIHITLPTKLVIRRSSAPPPP